ncbi:sugar ABC transporter substrate-binding protein [Aerococcus sanguinicola]|uniref:Sugar ABC transporter substrate-binding protein n=1 Tax=Aerococcus sanguinicola TaxID=119206 RepID=A0A0X8FB10_9LACT|nr:MULTISPECIES: extracellular solute-binding protein [Aerococcus]AMB93883.1 hypothetical protein AWM72_03485 [Aerococcus sanguinicola]MDK7050509.1 extracellular solute-binding protein [Aerococcus sanguinicola]OFT97153.1 hypothetical protein HMPREF3090_01365 [Aerococcus sp. HMSC23C02]PKZ21167.1 hypothetical protein CYJ28_08245 [Aerococcus sanguinicola]
MGRLKQYLTFIMLALIYLTGCSNAGMGTGEETSSSSQEPEAIQASLKEEKPEISFIVPEDYCPDAALLDQFENETGVRVKLVPSSWDTIYKEISQKAVGKEAGADIFAIDWSWLGEFKTAGWLAPLELDEETIKDIPTVKNFHVGNAYYALPYANDYWLAYYQPEAFAQLGRAPQNWSEVSQFAEAVQREASQTQPLALPLSGDEATSRFFFTMNKALTGEVFSKDYRLNRDNALATLEVLNTLKQKGLVEPGQRSQANLFVESLKEGTAAYSLGPVAPYFQSQTKGQNEPRLALLPGDNQASKASLFFGPGLAISSYSDHPEAAQLFVEWYTSEERQVAAFEKFGLLPTRQSALNQVLSSGQVVGADTIGRVSEGAGALFSNGAPSYYRELSHTLARSIHEMLEGRLSPEEAADQMTEEVDAIVERNL